jgi:hypothetical protein
MTGIRRPIVLAVMAVLAVFAWIWLDVRYVYSGNQTGLFCLGQHAAGPAKLTSGAVTFKRGYDGQFYRCIAHDPWFQKGYSRYIDDARLRCRRILIPAAAWLLAFGNDAWVDTMYVLLIVLSIGFGVYWSARYLQLNGGQAAWGLMFLVSAGTLVSVDRMLLEAPLAALFMGFVVYATTGEWRKAYIVAMLAMLTREAGVFLIAGIVLYFAIKRLWRAAVVLSSAALPGLVWYLIVWLHTKESNAVGVVTWPLWGIVRRLLTVRHEPGELWKQQILQPLDFLAVLAFLACLVLVAVWIWRGGPGPVELSLAFFVAMGLILGGREHMRDVYGYARPVAPMLAYILVRAAASRRWLTALPSLALSAWIGVFYVLPLTTVARGLLGSVGLL